MSKYNIYVKKFKRIFIEVTNTCNLSCDFCPGTRRAPAFMDRALFDKIITEVQPLTEEVVLHILGEPLRHPDLLCFIDHALSHELSVMITTNGTLLSGNAAETLATKDLRQVNISLHCLEAVADKEQYVQNVVDFARAAQKNHPDGYINLRLWNMHTEDNSWVMSQLNTLFNTDIVLPTDINEFKDWKGRELAPHIYLHIDSRFDWPTLDGPVLQDHGFCYGLRSHIGILVDGTVVPCCLDSEGVIALGNITQQTLDSIINSDRATKMQRALHKGELTENLCRRCGYIQRFSNKVSTHTKTDDRLPAKIAPSSAKRRGVRGEALRADTKAHL